MTQLQGTAHSFAFNYLRMLSISLPFTMVMFIAGSCQRGGGDTITPAIVMVHRGHHQRAVQLGPVPRMVWPAGDGI